MLKAIEAYPKTAAALRRAGRLSRQVVIESGSTRAPHAGARRRQPVARVRLNRLNEP